MNRSKKLFLVLAAIFIMMLIAFGIDVARKTTFPGRQKADSPGQTVPGKETTEQPISNQQ